jgi:hypothetical protein
MAGPYIVRIKVRPRWWLKHYVLGVVLTAWLMGVEPDWQKVQRVMARGFKVTTEPMQAVLVA